MNTDIPSGAPMGTGSLADADDTVLVLEARALRRRLRLLARVLKGLVLLALFGTCAGIALLPGQVRFQCRSKQSEAKGNLKALYVALESYRAEYDVYSDDFAALEFTPKGAKTRYRYVVTDVVAPAPGREPSFVAWAIADDTDPAHAGDAWCIDDTNTITNLHNICEADQW
jgi:type II secretory pathway pseudopilin PulG